MKNYPNENSYYVNYSAIVLTSCSIHRVGLEIYCFHLIFYMIVIPVAFIFLLLGLRFGAACLLGCPSPSLLLFLAIVFG